MRFKFGTDLNKLNHKIQVERLYKTNFTHEGFDEEMNNKRPKQNEKKTLEEQLNFLKKILTMIKDGASGFDLAFEVEKNKEIKSLIFDGIMFYNTFIEIGNERFSDVPNKKTIDYKAFRTVEETEKYIFLVWLEDTIKAIKKEINPKDDYSKFKKIRKTAEIKKAQLKKREKLTHCKNCGERIKSIEQDFCEKCGIPLVENL